MLQRDRQRQRERGTFSGGGAVAFTAEYLVVAGGGSGGGYLGAGGGAGGYRSSVTGESSGGGASAESPLSIALGTPYTVTVGAGGASASGAVPGYNGGDSVFATVTSLGGGYGGSNNTPGPGYLYLAGAVGGSGGGGTQASVGSAGTAGQGFAGGAQITWASDYGTGGGGGAAQAGSDGSSTFVGDGGDGVQSLVTGTAVYRAGGGGGSSFSGALGAGSGGLGGGGTGGNNGFGTNGVTNTGGGGGGTGNLSSASAAGGSGVVIIRVPSTVVAEFSAGVVYNYIPLDDFNVYEITAAGVSDTVTFSQGAVTTVGESLLFNDNDTAYLTRTPASAGNRQKFTWSGWIKRATLGTDQFVFGANSGASVDGGLVITSSNTLGFSISGNLYNKYTSAVFRDPSAWYHVVIQFDTTQAAAENRIRIYVNGKEETDYTTQNSGLPPLNASTNYLNTATNHTIGRLSGYTQDYFDGYLSDVYFIDGQALDPSRFGKQDADGVWQPISYTGTYGTNGFHLDFADNSTAAALGTDVSGNSNDWTPSGITTDDQVSDTPSVNYPTFNSAQIANGNTLSDGNLRVTTSASNYGPSTATIAFPQSGKWYWEVSYEFTTGSDNLMVGIYDSDDPVGFTTYVGQTANSYGYYANNGNKYNNGSNTSYGIAYPVGSTIGVAFDADVGSLTFYTNGVSQGTAFTGLTKTYYPAVSDASGIVSVTSLANFGQRPFAYTPPAGFQALNSANLPAPVITDGKQHFQPVLYTGNGTTQAIGGLEFQPDMVWIKARSAAYDHQLYDAVRGTGSTLFPNLTQAEGAYNTLTSFDSTGFTVDASTYLGTNGSGTTFVSWNWNAGGSTVTNTDGTITSQVRANTDAGFSIVSYTGAASSFVGHGLNKTPELIILKQRNVTDDWPVYSKELGRNFALILSTTSAALNISNYWGTADPTSSVFGTSTNPGHGNANGDIIAYCFASVDGFSKFGSYTGNGSADGPFVYTGFRPAFVMVKRTDSTADWQMYDTKRGATNVITTTLAANSLAAESFFASGYDIDLVSNGFKPRVGPSNVINASGGTYIYMAFAENPFKTARAR